jgi:predicted 3-demethylubiquinone-9 3-methyltransferase (glyoxalase superfamily)
MQKITTFLWFDRQAEEAMNHYLSIFRNSKVLDVTRAGGAVLSVRFQLEGQEFIGLNGGPLFPFTEAISLFVDCESQAEVDELWGKLCATPSRCGWLKDKFGLSWQIVPSALGRMLGDPDPVKAKRVLDEMMTMGKLDIARLQAAYRG